MLRSELKEGDEIEDILQKIINLKKEYPDYEVKFLLDTSFFVDDCNFIEVIPVKVEISFWANYKYDIFTDKEELEYKLSDDCPCFDTTVEYDRWFDEKYKELDAKDVILIWLE